MVYKINVTEQDIGGGCLTDGDNCPIALAVFRETGHRLFVSEEGLEIWRTHLRLVEWPPRIQRWIADYDRGREVLPISFDIELPESLVTE